MEYSPVLVLLLLLMSTCNCQNMFYIRPSDNSHCPQEVSASQCYDLTTLVSEGHLSTTPNTSLLLFPGQHFLKEDLSVTNAKEFQMSHYYSEQGISSASDVEIVCVGYSCHSVRVQNVSSVKIKSIIFQSCGIELMSVDHSEITDCKWSESRSSAISIQDSNSVISDCQFMNGNCSNCSGVGIFAANSNVNFAGNNIATNNSVEGQYGGGGLSLIGSSVLIDGNLTIANNLAIRNLTGIEISYGGGIYAENCRFITTNTSYLSFEKNNAGIGGGIVIKACNSIFDGHIEFSGSSAGRSGGGMAVWGDSANTFNGQVEFSGNSAGGDGGGMSVSVSNNTFNGQVKFSSNSADNDGGVMIVLSDSANTFNGQVEFSGNTAGDGGGMSVCFFFNNTFNGHVEFSGNTADDGNGGGMSVCIFSNNTFNGQVEFSGNSADSNGGGMIVLSRSANTFNGQAAWWVGVCGRGRMYSQK